MKLRKWQKVIDQNRTYFVYKVYSKYEKKLCLFHEILSVQPNIYLGFYSCLCGIILLLAFRTYSHTQV